MSISQEGWLPDQNANFISNLLTTHTNKRLAELILFSRSIKTLSVDHPARVHLDYAMNIAKALPPGALAAAFSEPEFHYWSYISQCIRRRIENNESVPHSDVPHLSSVIRDSADPILLHTLELNRFLVAASIMASSPMECQLLVHDGNIMIPSIGLLINIDSSVNITPVALTWDRVPRLFVSGDELDGFHTCVEVALKKNGGIEQGALKVLPWVRMSTGSFIINGVDPYIRHAWVRSYRNADTSQYGEVSEVEYKKWHTLLSQTVNLLAECWPQMETEIGEALRTVIPVISPVLSTHMSCSKDVMSFALLMSEGRPVMLAEAFIHEFSHNILNSLNEFEPVFLEPLRVKEDLYSPWRQDSRHLFGVFHAVFVFERVCEFYMRYLVFYSDDEVRHRFRLMTIRNLIALDVVSAVIDHLDAFGIQLLDLIKSRILVHADSLAHGDWMAVKNEVLDHYNNWLLQNINTQPPISATLVKLKSLA